MMIIYSDDFDYNYGNNNDDDIDGDDNDGGSIDNDVMHGVYIDRKINTLGFSENL